MQRQLFLGKPLFICMVDFSKAFDLVNIHILFYKLMKHGYLGKVIDILRSLYRKTYFKVNCNGMQIPPILDQLGVNQGVNASPTLFGTYLADLGEYLTKHVGLCISDSPHIVDWWFSSNLRQRTVNRVTKAVERPTTFLPNNLMIVNELITKVLVFGSRLKANVHVHRKHIEQVGSYKYLGNIYLGKILKRRYLLKIMIT